MNILKAKAIEFIKSNGFLMGALVLILSNFITKYLLFVRPISNVVYPSTMVKFAFILIVLLLFVKNHLKTKISIAVAVLFFLFLINLIDDYKLFTKQLVIENIHYFLKHIFLFLLIPVIYSLGKNSILKTINWLVVIGVANVGLMFLGFIFDINLFKSYPNTARFGYNGVLPIQGVGTFFYAFLILISFFKAYQEKNNRTLWTYFLIILIGSILLGTKASYLFTMLFLIGLLFLYIKNKVLIFTFFIAVGLFIAVFFKKIIMKMIALQNIGKDIYEEKGVFTFLMSKRDLLFQKALAHINKEWTVVNYFVGGLNFKSIRVELELIDIFLFFGILGVIVYCWMIKSFFYIKGNPLYNYFLALVLFISMLTGNLFSSITNTLFFVIAFTFLQDLKPKKW
jgi:O-antigen ligase